MSEESPALVSVVVPAYNAERYLRQALESILAQAHRPLEIFVVDDGSEDGTAAVARSFGPEIRLLGGGHAGAGAARNRGVEPARGEFLAFLDADDLWTPRKLESQLALFHGDPSLDYVLGYATEFRIAADGSMIDGAIRIGASAGALLIRGSSFRRVGALRTDLRIGEFIDWFARARELRLRHVVANEVVLRRRIHDTNTGIRERDGRSDYAEVVRAALARRRGAV